VKNGEYPSHYRATGEKKNASEEKSIRTTSKVYVYGILPLSKETDEEKTHNQTVLTT